MASGITKPAEVSGTHALPLDDSILHASSEYVL